MRVEESMRCKKGLPVAGGQWKRQSRTRGSGNASVEQEHWTYQWQWASLNTSVRASTSYSVGAKRRVPRQFLALTGAGHQAIAIPSGGGSL